MELMTATMSLRSGNHGNGTMSGNHTYGYDHDLYPHSIICATIYVFITICGLIGNTLVIVGVAVNPKLRTPTNVILVNLAIADLFTCLVLPFQAVGLLSGSDSLPRLPLVCGIVGGVIYVAFTCSAINLVLISIIRCTVITRKIRGAYGLNTVSKQIFLALLAWILAATYILVPVYAARLTSFAYYPAYKQCFTQPSTYSEVYHNSLAILIGIHMIVMVSCYIRIVVFVRRQHKDINSFYHGSVFSSNLHHQTIKRQSKRELSVTKNLFVVIVAFIVCTLPTVVAFAMPGMHVVGLYTTAILYFNNCINPILYAFKHPVFKQIFASFLRSLLGTCGCRRVTSKRRDNSPTTMSTVSEAP